MWLSRERVEFARAGWTGRQPGMVPRMLPFDGSAPLHWGGGVLAVFLTLVWAWLIAFTAGDLLRRADLSVGHKAAWLLVMVGVPIGGVLLYIARDGVGMAERRKATSDELRHALRALATSASDELVKLEALRARQAISAAEYDRLRAQLLG